MLRCSCEARARSAREIGCFVRIRLKIRFRLISRGILFDALCWCVNVNRCAATFVIPSPLLISNRVDCPHATPNSFDAG